MATSTERMQKLRSVDKEVQKLRNKINSKAFRDRNKNNELYKLKNRIRRRINYTKNKNKGIQDVTELNGYKKRNTLLRKVREVKQSLPKDVVKQSQILNELDKVIPRINDNKLIMQRKEPSEEEKLVVSFYEKESTVLPGIKDCFVKKNESGQKEIVRKQVLNDSKDNLFMKFKVENPSIQIGRTKFFKLSPNNCLSFTKMPEFSCLCKIHENFKMAFDALKSKMIDNTVNSLPTFLKDLTCDTENFSCMMNSCKSCQNVTQKIMNMVNISQNEMVSYRQWESKNGKTMEVVKKIQSNSFIKSFAKQTLEFRTHSYISDTQSKKLYSSINEFDPKTAKIIFDFSENFSIQLQNEIQQAYYGRQQVTLYTAVAYISIDSAEGREIVSISFGIISDSLHHDKYAVYAFNNFIFNSIVDQYDFVEGFDLYSDGAPAHFKSYFSIATLKLFKKMYGRDFVWNFAATSHGKSPADGVGGTIKSMVQKRIKSQNLLISSAKEFYEAAKEICQNFNIVYIEEKEIEKVKQKLDKFWKSAKPIKDIRSHHRFEAFEGSLMKISMTSLGHCEKIVKII